MNEQFDPDSSQIKTDEEVPDLVDEPDNDPDDTAEYQAVETQDREPTIKPAVDRHPED